MNSNEKNPSVSIAIPKAKPKMERVSPGVYRDNKGALVRSRDGQQGPPPAPHRQPLFPNEGGRIADGLGRAFGPSDGGAGVGNWMGPLKDGPGMTDAFDGAVPMPKPNGRGNLDELLAAISQMSARPAPRPSNPLLSGPANPIAKRPMTPPPAPVDDSQMFRSITDLLRGR